MKLRISIPNPMRSGPVSCGTVGVIKAAREHLGLSLKEAKVAVDECVFGSGSIVLDVSESVDVHCFLEVLAELGSGSPVVLCEIVE